MTELKQKYLLQELAKAGFHNARYDSKSGEIEVQPGDNCSPMINSDGDIRYGKAFDHMVIRIIRPIADRVNEVIEVWEQSQAALFEGVSNFRLLLQYNGYCLCARDDTERGHGFHFVTWRVHQPRNIVESGNYTTDFETAKEDFAKRVGLIRRNKILTAEQAMAVKAAIDYRVSHDDSLTMRTVDMLKEIFKNLDFAYSEID